MPSLPTPARDLGVPITAACRISYKTVPLPSGNLLCWTTTAESGGHFSALALKSGQVYTHPLHSLEAYPILPASDGRVCVGSTSGEVMVWDPPTDTWQPLGPPLFPPPTHGINHVRALCEGREGWLYAGNCTGQRARIHLHTGQVETLPAIPEEGNWYVSAAAALPDGRIAFGLGHCARLFVYDPVQGRDVGQWLPPGWIEDGFCLNLLMGERVLYATHFPSGRRAAFDAASGQLLGQPPWPPAYAGQTWSKWVHSSGYGSPIDFYLLPGSDTALTCDGAQIHSFDPHQPGQAASQPVAAFTPPASLALELRWEVSTDCRVLEYDAVRLQVRRAQSPPQPPVERGLFGLGTGPDGKVYGGAFQSTLLFACNPDTEAWEVLGDHHPGWGGETYSFAARGHELICASYTNGALVAYDPQRPWDCETGRMTNPRLLGFLGQQVYRPYNTCVDEQGRIWSVGPAGWGSTGGGVAYLDPRTGQGASTALTEAPIDVVPLGGDQLLVCHPRWLRWWQGATNAESAHLDTPLTLVSATGLDGERVLLASRGEVWVVRATLPGHLETLCRHPSPLPLTRALVWKGQAVIGGPDGFAVLDLETGKSQIFCNTPLGSRLAFALAGGKVFFHQGTHLRCTSLP